MNIIKPFTMKKTFNLLTLTTTLGFICFLSISATKSAEPTKDDQVEKENINNPPFSVNLNSLKNRATSEETQWFNVGDDKHLLLIHRAKARKERGHVLLLHAQSENADHLRLIQPLSKQLARLGWRVYIPNIAKEDFPPPKINQKSQTVNENIDGAPNDDNSSTSPTPDQITASTKEYFFKSMEIYQEYYSTLCQSILEQTDIGEKPLILIANQNSAYWSIQCLNKFSAITPIIMLEPELPKNQPIELETLFAQQTSPLFSFSESYDKKNPFSNAFEKRIWKAKNQRFNVGMLSSSKMNIEDISVAKTITGWIEKQRKK